MMSSPALTDLVRQLRTLDSATDSDLLDRYLSLRDQEAFETLVQRHQQTVLSACRQVLTDTADIDDAFQATFLVLLSKTKSACWRPSLGGWLYAVAHRVAVHLRRTQQRRLRREAQVAIQQGVASQPLDLSWRESIVVLHEELDRLPHRFRLPLLLCYLEGLSRDEAATQLGWTAGTLRGRLARGRRMLHRKLIRRGITLSAGLLAAVAPSGEGAVAASPSLVAATVQSTLGAGSARARLLARICVSGFRTRVKTALGVLAVFGMCLGLLASDKSQKEPPKPSIQTASDEKKPEKPSADPESEFRYAGIVLDPEGKPLAGATIHICGLQQRVIEFKPRVKTGADGRFDFVVKREEIQFREPFLKLPRIEIGATAPGCGGASVSASKAEERDKLILRLPEEQIITGRVIGTEGKPIAGITMGYSLSSGKLNKEGKPIPFDSPETEERQMPNYLPYLKENAPPTDKEGRFTLRGVSKDWLYDLYIFGPGVQTLRAQLVARPQKQKAVGGTGESSGEGLEPTLVQYGSEFTHVALRDKPITGIVRDKNTGKPLADISVCRPFVRDPEPPMWTTTDKDGRFHFEGIAPGQLELRVNPQANQPYIQTRFPVDTTKGPASFECTLELERQLMIVGRVADQETGKPVAGWVEYRASAANPNLKNETDLAQPRWNSPKSVAEIDKEGKFAIHAIPGRGVLLVKANGTCRPARLTEADRKVILAFKDNAELLDTKPYPVLATEFHAVRAVDIPKNGGDFNIDLAVDSGHSINLDFKYPGEKSQETWVLGLMPASFDRIKEFAPKQDRVGAITPGEPRHVFAVTRDDALGGHLVLNGGERDSVTLEMKPTGGITGRLVNSDGKPVASQGFQLYYEDGAQGVSVSWGHSYRLPTENESKQRDLTTGIYGDRWGRFSMPEHSGEDGKFQIAKLIPDVNFDLWVVCIDTQLDPKTKKPVGRIVGHVKVKRTILKPGETKDLGDIVVKRPG
jgi:RNA polymerase sigma factor (sigma-70 family)